MPTRYEQTYYGICCGIETEIHDSLEDIVLDGHDFGTIRVQTLSECGHWDYTGEQYELHNIELYELAEYLEDWGVDTLDSDRFIVYTNGEYDPIMLKILDKVG